MGKDQGAARPRSGLRRRLDDIRGSWLLLVALLCGAGILALGLGSEKVRRVARAALPRALGGSGPRAEEAPGEVVAPEDEGEKKEEGPPAPAKETAVRGIVRDFDGGPIAGATVTAERMRRGRWETLSSGKTDKEGRFAVGPLPSAQLSMVARAEGYAPQRKPASPGSAVEFKLQRGGSLSGKCVDAVTGEPVAGALLSGWGNNWWETTESAKDGTFRFPSVTPGRLWINVTSAAYRDQSVSDLEVKAGEETVKEIPLVKGGVVKGKVLDRENGVPVAGATVRTWDGTKTATSGEDGSYELPSPAADGGMSLQVSAPGYPEQWQWISLSGDPNGTFERDLKIGKGGKVTGSVRKGDGSPAAGAKVGTDPGELLSGVDERSTVADAEGRFVLENVPAGNGLRLSAVAPGSALSMSDRFELRSGTETGGIVITLQSGTTFKGSVKGEEGDPLAGVSLTLNRQWTQADWQRGWFWIPSIVGYTEEDGSFIIPNVPEGTWTMQVALDGYAPETRKDLACTTEGEKDGLEFVLRRGTVITGIVSALDGTALSGVSVNAWGWVPSSDGQWQWVQRSDVRSDAEGRFTLDGLREGAYQLNFQLPGFAATSLHGIAAGTRDLPVTLAPMGRIEGVVTESDGNTPVASFSIRVFLEEDAEGNPQGPGNDQGTHEFADREGKFTVKDLGRGVYGVEAIAGSRISRRVGGLTVGPGMAPPPVRLTVTEGGKLKVTIRDPSGQPVPQAGLSAGLKIPGGGWNFGQWVQADPNGVASFAALQEGTWLLNCDMGDRGKGSREVILGGGSDIEVDLNLKRGGNVLVWATGPEGPLEGVQVTFRSEPGGNILQLDWGRLWNRAWRESGGRNVDWNQLQRKALYTDAFGRLVREGLPSGPVYWDARKDGFLVASGHAQVLEGYESDLPIRLEPDPAKAKPPEPPKE
jgi:hypothetical protein